MAPGNGDRMNARVGAPDPNRHSALWLAAGIALVALVSNPAPGLAASISIGLSVEFDSGEVGSYGQVLIEENGNDLDFTIQLSDALGDDIDLHEFYFSLDGDFNRLRISNTDSPNTRYSLDRNPSVAGGAGSSFDYGVNFGNGGGRRGNGKLCCASFTLSANEALTINDLRVATFTNDSTIAINLAVHVQGTTFDPNADSETVGGVIPRPNPIPEPGTGPLLAMSLVGLAAYQWLRRPSASGSSARISAS